MPKRKKKPLAKRRARRAVKSRPARRKNPMTMTPTEHEKREWSRMAHWAYKSDRNDIGHRYSAAGALMRGQSIPIERFDALQAGYREWLNFNKFPLRDENPRRRRRKSAALTVRGFIIQLKKTGHVLYFDGERFSDNHAPKYYATQAKALTQARKILDRNPKINRLGYQMGVQQESSRMGARRANPSIREGLAQAERKLQDFSGHKATEVLRVKEKNAKTGLVIGDLDGVLYTTTRDGNVEKYIHRFRRKSRPLLAASSDGKTLKIVGGRFEFTEAGIVDR
jgi:hypothetical protein